MLTWSSPSSRGISYPTRGLNSSFGKLALLLRISSWILVKSSSRLKDISRKKFLPRFDLHKQRYCITWSFNSNSNSLFFPSQYPSHACRMLFCIYWCWISMSWSSTRHQPPTVSEHGVSLHEDLQPHLYDALDRSLEWMSSILGSNASRISSQFLGCHQWTSGKYSLQMHFKIYEFLLLLNNVNPILSHCVAIWLLFLFPSCLLLCIVEAIILCMPLPEFVVAPIAAKSEILHSIEHFYHIWKPNGGSKSISWIEKKTQKERKHLFSFERRKKTSKTSWHRDIVGRLHFNDHHRNKRSTRKTNDVFSDRRTTWVSQWIFQLTSRILVSLEAATLLCRGNVTSRKGDCPWLVSFDLWCTFFSLDSHTFT
jgi:hypothetical protein